MVGFMSVCKKGPQGVSVRALMTLIDRTGLAREEKFNFFRIHVEEKQLISNPVKLFSLFILKGSSTLIEFGLNPRLAHFVL